MFQYTTCPCTVWYIQSALTPRCILLMDIPRFFQMSGLLFMVWVIALELLRCSVRVAEVKCHPTIVSTLGHARPMQPSDNVHHKRGNNASLSYTCRQLSRGPLLYRGGGVTMGAKGFSDSSGSSTQENYYSSILSTRKTRSKFCRSYTSQVMDRFSPKNVYH